MKTISKHLPDFEDLRQKSLQDAAFPLYIAIDENRFASESDRLKRLCNNLNQILKIWEGNFKLTTESFFASFEEDVLPNVLKQSPEKVLE